MKPVSHRSILLACDQALKTVGAFATSPPCLPERNMKTLLGSRPLIPFLPVTAAALDFSQGSPYLRPTFKEHHQAWIGVAARPVWTKTRSCFSQ